jgi:mannose-6-phosphate isomerase-like protein (cupin superfamily)
MNAAQHDVRSVDAQDFSAAIEAFERRGYRLLMIKPADSPREALMRSNTETIRLVANPYLEQNVSDPESFNRSGWVVGRAGMMYRDLVPDRLGGKLIVSHIRIVDGGAVNDRVHFHKIDFQIIYCLKGAIKVVYEDQGDPFWLKPGDCVLQPPEIRHRVLEAEAGSEVIEITSPAEHETWFDHDLELPSASTRSNRSFNGTRFVRHQASECNWIFNEKTGLNESLTAIHKSGVQMPKVTTLQNRRSSEDLIEYSTVDGIFIRVLIGGY